MSLIKCTISNWILINECFICVCTHTHTHTPIYELLQSFSTKARNKGRRSFPNNKETKKKRVRVIMIWQRQSRSFLSVRKYRCTLNHLQCKGTLSWCRCTRYPKGVEVNPRFIISIYSESLLASVLSLPVYPFVLISLVQPTNHNFGWNWNWKRFGSGHFFDLLPHSALFWKVNMWTIIGWCRVCKMGCAPL